MTPANAAWFDRPATKLRALGFDTDFAFGIRLKSQQRLDQMQVTSSTGVSQSLLQNGGLVDVQTRVIAAGTRLVRFGSGVLVPNVASGEWWLDWDAYKIVENYADSSGVSIPVAVRKLCCVPLEWNQMTLIIEARAIQPLLAYEGFGAPATARGGKDHVEPATANRLGLKQLFIPGLSDPDLRRDALLITGYGFLRHELSTAGYFPCEMP